MKNLHLIPTDKLSRLHYYNDIYPIGLSKEHLQWKQGRNIHITSDEEIKEGYVFNTFNHTVYKIVSNNSPRELLSHPNVLPLSAINNEHYFNIILTTDQDLIKDGIQAIDDEFLEWFVKNPSCEYVKVREKGNVYGIVKGFGVKSFSNGYKIIIPKGEPKQSVQEYEQQGLEKYAHELKQETLEEAAEEYDEKNANDEYGQRYRAFIAGAKWQAERMVTKEEPKRKIDTCHNFDIEIGCVQDICRCEQKEGTLTIVDKLKDYFKNISKEQIKKDWEESCEQTKGIISPTIEEFLDAQKEGTLKEAELNEKEFYEYMAKQDSWKSIGLIIQEFIKFKLKEQQEERYSEEEVLEIIYSLFHQYSSIFRQEAKEYFLQFKKK